MKKSMVTALVMAACLTLMASSCCFAQFTGVADTSKEGSLLVWPLIQTNDGNETYIVINNTGAGDVNVKCYWEIRAYPYSSGGTTCELSDAAFELTPYNPLIFRASDGSGLDGRGVAVGMGEGNKGVLKCWAVDPADEIQISWNHLSGHAIIVQPDDTNPLQAKESAWEYSAWRFAANILGNDNATLVDYFRVGKKMASGQNTMRLSGVYTKAFIKTAVGSARPACPAGTVPVTVSQTFPKTGDPRYTYYCVAKRNPNTQCKYPYKADSCNVVNAVYDACPGYLSFDFLAGGEPSDNASAFNHLVLLPCKEDLRSTSGDFDYPTRLSFSVWNANEVKYTGTQSCAHCDGANGSTYELYLNSSMFSRNFFNQYYLHTSSGSFRVVGLAGGICPGAKSTPLIGVMATRIGHTYGADGGMKSRDIVGTTPTTAGLSLPTSGTASSLEEMGGYILWDTTNYRSKPQE